MWATRLLRVCKSKSKNVGENVLLKSLEVQGFKTFPDKTVLSFGSGITAVVGPNGSGKSNISDAIRWVLGEQSTKILRCSKMEDVVFSGTPLRKAQGFAEVTLTVDNADRRLPFDADEVAVTRRYYRSGDSEYLINKAAVRLRDIHELFMDTGLGRDGYSIISQGKIDSIVASRSEDRREIFEEAAGISRYRYRKTEAERRLKQTEENLLRLRDILVELEDRVEPLRVQSEKARQYLEFANEKRTLEIGLWLTTLDKSSQVLREQEDKIAIARRQHELCEQALQELREEAESVFGQTNAHTAKADEVRREISTHEEQIAQKDKQASVLQNDILHNTETINRIERELSEADSSMQTMDAQIEWKLESIDKLNRQIDEKNKELERLTYEMEHLRESMDKFQGENDSLQKEIAALTLKESDCRVTAVTSKSSIEEIATRLAAIEESLGERREERDYLQKELSGNVSERARIEEEIGSLQNTVKGYELRLQSRRQKAEEAKSQADKLALDADDRLRKARLLEDLERNLEGFAGSVKTVMKEASRGSLHGIHGPVSRLFKVPGEYAVAIETALGAAMQNIVVTGEQDAKKAIAFLKQRDGGRATFLPLSTIKGNVLREQGFDDCFGFVGVASELCRCEEQYQNIINSLLGRIVIAEDLDSATVIAKRYGYRFRIVTLDGQVVNAGGSLTGGSLGRNSGLLSRAGEIEKIKQEYTRLKEKAEEAFKQFQKQREEAAFAEAQVLGARGELTQKQEELIIADAAFKNCKSRIETCEAAYQALLTEQKTLNDRTLSLTVMMEAAKKEGETLQAKIRELTEQQNALLGTREESTNQREELSSAIHNLRLETLSLQKDIDTLNGEVKAIRERKADHDGRMGTLRQESGAVQARNAMLSVQIDNLNAESERLREKVKQCEVRIEQLHEERMALEKRSVELRQQERDKTEERETVGRDLARLEERKESLQKQYDEIISRLWEEYELTRREAEEVAQRVENITQAQKQLNSLKLKIKNLGTVNVAAIEEYKEVSERYVFMKEQVGDVEKSKEELYKLIHELTQQMRELFLERFHEINKNFGETFKELFGGGSAELRLTDESDVLNSGIEIAVEPPGKIVVHLEALSGGEKALVAIALYFAIMKVSPAPFCVLDEIEAALDDVNVDRFAAYLRRMNDNTQFIVITHRRGTMEEADVLYGVTMQDEGVSKLLELRASEIEQKLGMK